MSLTPPLLPPAAGSASDQSLVLLPSTGAFGSLGTPLPQLDFGLATGLDTTNLAGGAPVVRVTSSLRGFGGQALMGVGFATQLAMGTTYTIDANWTLPGYVTFAPFDVNLMAWIVADARDTSGRISRTRILFDTLAGSSLMTVQPQPIPTVTTPVAPFVGSPSVEFADVLDPNTMTGPILVGGQAMIDVIAEDAAGRRWTMLVVDTDVAGGTDTVQFPDLAGAGVTGLQTGTWNVRPEARLWFSLSANGNEYVLADRRRVEVSYSRGLAVPFTIQ
jgi:hypothetical protein